MAFVVCVVLRKAREGGCFGEWWIDAVWWGKRKVGEFKRGAVFCYKEWEFKGCL
jgi:hypothetical protein